MLLRKTHLSGENIPSSEITPLSVFRTGRPEPGMDRRRFLAKAGAGAGGRGGVRADAAAGVGAEPLKTVPGKFQATDTQTPFAEGDELQQLLRVWHDKDEPAKNAHTLKTRPWTVQVRGW